MNNHIIHLLAQACFGAAMALLVGASALAQTGRTVHGVVLSDEGGEPLAGATVRAFTSPEDTTLSEFGAITDAEGAFGFDVPYGGTVALRVTFVGYATQRAEFAADEENVLILMQRRDATAATVSVTAAKRTRSVEDACCRVESIRDEVQQHAPFAPSASDALARYSSCTSARISCSIGRTASTRLRGLEPTYAAVLLDGMPSFTGLATFYGLGIVPAHALQTIRISEGASSAAYGNGAVSGVVNLETRPPTEASEFSASAALQSGEDRTPGAADINVAYTGLVGDIGIAAFGSLGDHRDIDAGVGARARRASALLKGNVLIGDATELTVTGLYGRLANEGTFEPGESAEPYAESITLDRADVAIHAAHSLSPDAELNFNAMASGTWATSSFGRQPIDATQRGGYTELSCAAAIGDQQIRGGLSLHADRLTENGGLGIGYSRTTFGAYLQDEFRFSEQWSLLGSLRLDEHSIAGTQISPRGSIRFAPLPSMTMRLMAGVGFKADALFNEDHRTLHGTWRWRENPTFGFERSVTFNYDISYRFLIGDAAGIDANFNAYATTIRGKAVPQQDSLALGTLYYVNSPNPARLRGIELQLRPTFGTEWSGSLALALIDYAMADSAGTYRPMPLAPRANVDFSVMYHNEQAGGTAEIWGSVVGRQYLPVNPSGLERSAMYTVINARYEQQIGAVAVFAGVFNMLDARQSRTMGLAFGSEPGGADGSIVWGPLEGREAFIGARLTLGGSVVDPAAP